MALNPRVVVPGHGPLCDTRGINAVRDYLLFIEKEARGRFDAGKLAHTIVCTMLARVSSVRLAFVCALCSKATKRVLMSRQQALCISSVPFRACLLSQVSVCVLCRHVSSVP